MLLARSVGHVHKRVTDHLGVTYYVADSFTEEYTGSSLKTVERNVEDDYIANLRNNCWKEKQQSEYTHAHTAVWKAGKGRNLRTGQGKALLAHRPWQRPNQPRTGHHSCISLGPGHQGQLVFLQQVPRDHNTQPAVLAAAP